jgi:hypothetical protein
MTTTDGCWYHGYQVGLDHTSANCTKKAPGHKNDAINENIMGGFGFV